MEIEFLVFSLTSFFSVVFQNYYFWFAALLGLLIHMALIHILICFQFKDYVPGVVTSVIFVPVGIWLAAAVENSLHYTPAALLLAVLLGIGLLVVMILSLHKLMGVMSQWLYRYSEVRGVDTAYSHK